MILSFVMNSDCSKKVADLRIFFIQVLKTLCRRVERERKSSALVLYYSNMSLVSVDLLCDV